MAGSIYLIQSGDELIEMTEEPYDSEDRLQELLAKYPNLLAGDQMNSDKPRRWLLISRETAVPSEEEGAGRWSVDHLFLDQDAIPTLVEVKRSSDTRIRREVVGQMLDYAANAVVYWPIEKIRAQFEANCEAQERDPEQELEELLGAEADPEEFWQRAKTNLQAGKVRLVFVADEIPSELRRVVEFLNSQMDPAEVLGVEVRQYVGQELKTLVPRVIGQTAEAQRKKSGVSRRSKQWDEINFYEELESQRGSKETEVARKILSGAKDRMLRISWGTGVITGSFNPKLDHGEKAYSLFGVSTDGSMLIRFPAWYSEIFGSESNRLELLNRLNAIPAIDLSPDVIGKEHKIPLSILSDEFALSQFLGIIDWAIQEIKAS